MTTFWPKMMNILLLGTSVLMHLMHTASLVWMDSMEGTVIQEYIFQMITELFYEHTDNYSTGASCIKLLTTI